MRLSAHNPPLLIQVAAGAVSQGRTGCWEHIHSRDYFLPLSPSPPFFSAPSLPTFRHAESSPIQPQLLVVCTQTAVRGWTYSEQPGNTDACRGLIRISKSLLSCLFTSCGGNYVILVVVLAADGNPERSKLIFCIIVAKLLLSIKLFSLKRQNSEDILASSWRERPLSLWLKTFFCQIRFVGVFVEQCVAAFSSSWTEENKLQFNYCDQDLYVFV